MYTEIKTFEDACKAINVEPTIIPDFSLFPESDQQAMIAHAKLIIIAKAINGDWAPDWTNGNWDKYYPLPRTDLSARYPNANPNAPMRFSNYFKIIYKLDP